MNKILISIFALISLFSVTTFAEAAGGVSITPASATNTVGKTFNFFVNLDATTNKTYAVEGTLVFDKLNCNSITVATGITVQSAPTCSNPYFLLGISSGTNTGSPLLAVAVNAVSAGTASVSLSNVDIVGEGVSLGSSSTGGIYTIIAPAPLSVKGVSAEIKTTNTTASSSNTEATASTSTSTDLNQTAAVGSAVNTISSMWVWILVIIIILIVTGYIWYKNRKQ